MLLIDLDPQATLTLNFSKPEYNKNKTLKTILTEPTMIFLNQIVQKTKYENINIIVGGENLNKTSSLINLNYPNEKEQLLLAFNINRSLSKKGCPYDNAVAEATFKTFKTEFINDKNFTSLIQLKLELFDYINWYNNIRIHSTCNYLTPAKYQQQMSTKK